jgi:hypothetical protein
MADSNYRTVLFPGAKRDMRSFQTGISRLYKEINGIRIMTIKDPNVKRDNFEKKFLAIIYLFQVMFRSIRSSRAL